MNWRRRAACRSEDPDLFFPLTPGEVPEEAAEICASCPVTAQCRELGRDLGATAGVWGGKSRDVLPGRKRKRPAA